MAAQLGLMQGLHHNGGGPGAAPGAQGATAHPSEMAGSLHDAKLIVEPLENNNDLGVYLRQTSQDKEVYCAQFNPRCRLLASAGSGDLAHLWDLRSEDFAPDFKKVEIPHVLPKDQN